jgi:hypothetical protein
VNLWDIIRSILGLSKDEPILGPVGENRDPNDDIPEDEEPLSPEGHVRDGNQ